MTRLTKLEPAIKRARKLARGFQHIVRRRRAGRFTAWLEAATTSKLIEVTNFATSLQRDEAAIRNALTYEWSNGQVEGQINRLKTIKDRCTAGQTSTC